MTLQTQKSERSQFDRTIFALSGGGALTIVTSLLMAYGMGIPFSGEIQLALILVVAILIPTAMISWMMS